MKRTGPLPLIVAALLGIAAGFGFDALLTSTHRATYTPGVSLPVLLVLLGLLCLAFAWPIRRAVHDEKAPRVDPFRAMRTAVLAKSSSIVGAAIGGSAVGFLAFVLTRPVHPGIGSMATTIATVAAGAVLVACALIAEYFCTLPKDPPDDSDTDHSRAGLEPL
ncbi:MAG: DUF3180 domain-containing protein [Microbacterium sp.]